MCTVSDPRGGHRSLDQAQIREPLQDLSIAQVTPYQRFLLNKYTNGQDSTLCCHRITMATTSTAASSSGPSNKGGTAYLAIQSTFVAIATLLSLIRVYVRTIVVKKFGLDDAAILLALVSILFTNINRKPTEIRFSLSSSLRRPASQSTIVHCTSLETT